jgi:VanZ family protein
MDISMKDAVGRKQDVWADDILRPFATAVDARMESAPNPSSRLVVLLLVATAVYWLGMFVGTHLPVTPDPERIPNRLDIPQHLFAFAGLAFLLCLAGAARGVPSRLIPPTVLAVIAIYGMLDEFTQTFVRHRQADVIDWCADMLGAGLGIAAFSLVQLARTHRSEITAP